MANQAEDKITAIGMENVGFTNMRLNTANANPRYRNSSDRPAVHARAVNTTDSLIVRGMIFSVSRNKDPRCSSGIRAIIRRLANWLAQRRPVRANAIHADRHGSAVVRPRSTRPSPLEKALQATI